MNGVGFVTTGPQLVVRRDGQTYSATCPECPRWTAVADDWGELMHIAAAFHRGPDATHRAWTMVDVWLASDQRAGADQ